MDQYSPPRQTRKLAPRNLPARHGNRNRGLSDKKNCCEEKLEYCGILIFKISI